MKSNKERVYYYLQEHSDHQNEQFKGFTTSQLAVSLRMQRSNVSAILNELVKEQKVVKLQGRPVYYQLMNQVRHNEKENSCFQKLIGYDTTLKNAVKLAKAAILYPENPLSTLILGKNGVGKSFFAALMAEYEKTEGVISYQAPFVKFNCSYYINQDEKLIHDLFDEDNKDSCVNQARNGVLFIDHIEHLSASAKNRLAGLIESGINIHIICSDSRYPHMNEDVLISKFPVQIYLPSLTERKLAERLQLVSRFFTSEAVKMKKEIKINSELLRCFLLYPCEGNLKQLKHDIQIACANAYVRIIEDQGELLYVYVYDCPSYVRKGFLFYKDYRSEVEALIPSDFTYTFTYDSLKATQDPSARQVTMYDTIDKKISELRERGIGEEDIATILFSNIKDEVRNYTDHIENKNVNKETLSKIVDEEVIEMVDEWIREASERFNRVYASGTFVGLCMYVSNMITLKSEHHLGKDKITEIIENNHDEYRLCEQFMETLKQKYKIQPSAADVALMALFLTGQDEKSQRNTKPALLIAMHGTVAGSIVHVIDTLIPNARNIYAFDLLLDNDLNEVYEQLKHCCQKIAGSAGILLVYDMGSIRKMAENIMEETGIPIKMIEMPTTLTIMDYWFKINEINDLNEAYRDIMNSALHKPGASDAYKRSPDIEKVIVTLCMTGKGTALQMKQYIENNVMLDPDMSIIPLAVSDRKLLMENINSLLESYTIQCVIGTYDPKLYGLPFISISRLFDTPPEQLSSLLSLEYRDEAKEIDYDQMYAYLDEQLENVDIQQLKRVLRPAVINIKRLIDDRSMDMEIGLFIHIACSIGRIVNDEPKPINMQKNRIINGNKRLYHELKEILNPIENTMKIHFDDDEIAILIEMIK